MLAVVLVVLFYLCLHEGLIANGLNFMNLVPKEEPLTELFFNDTPEIRRTPGQFKVVFSFTINNLEDRSMTYPYEVYFEASDGSKTHIASDSMMLEAGESKVIDVSKDIFGSSKDGKVIVEIPSMNEHVLYRVPAE